MVLIDPQPNLLRKEALVAKSTSAVIVIGGQSYPVACPSDIEARLLAATGCSAVELAGALGDFTTGNIAHAVRPFLADDAPSAPELAQGFAADLERDRAGTLAAVRALLTSPVIEPTKGDTV